MPSATRAMPVECAWARVRRSVRLAVRAGPDAVFAVSDGIATGLIDALRSAAIPIGVPGRVSAVGFDGVATALHPPYELTTILVPVAALIRRGLDLLLARITEPDAPDELVTLRGELHLGRSARLPATPDGT